jgi:hypothetical protein
MLASTVTISTRTPAAAVPDGSIAQAPVMA